MQDEQKDAFNASGSQESSRRGFPNAAQSGKTDYGLNLNDLVLKNPASTYFMRIESDQYQEIGLSKGDYISIDRAAQRKLGSLVVVHSDGNFKIVRNDDLNAAEHEITGDIIIWGVITWVIRPV